MILRWFIAVSLCILPMWAQAAGTLTVSVADPNGGAVEEAVVRLSVATAGIERSGETGPDGICTLKNLPLQGYTMEVMHPGFASRRFTVPVRSNIPVKLDVRLEVASRADAIQVTAFERPAAVDPEVTGTRTELSAAAIERMPLRVGNRGLESVLLSFPGFAADANGAIHPRGAHNQMTYVVDGVPISDQLTGGFGNSLDANIAQTLELYTGNIPAEFGSKISGVANITTRSGLGSGRRFAGNVQSSFAQFDTISQVAQFSGGTERAGYFASFSGLKSNHFLDQVSTVNLHNGGNAERAFARLDFQANPRDSFRMNVMAGRSSFELANLRSQQNAGQDQRQLLRDFAASLSWLRVLNASTTLDFTASYRTTVAQLFPSPGDTPVTAAQARHLSTIIVSGRASKIWRAHTLRAGADYQRFPVSENFSFGITHPRFNDPRSPNFIPTLLAYDLSRGGELFEFSDSAAGSLQSVFAQDQFRWGRFAFSPGLRYDDYRFLVPGHQLQPRLGLSFHLPETGTALRISYNRVYQTPVNENLLLSNSSRAAVLVPAHVRNALGGALLRIRPERQNVYEAGIQQSVGARVALNAAYYYKDERDLHDNDNFFNTGIIFPTSLSRSRVNGAELRVNVAESRGLSGSLSLTHYHVVVTPPFTGGLFLGNTALKLLAAGPFVIDHDQTLGAQANVVYAIRKYFWCSGSVRYDSGLVSNPSDPLAVAADPDYADLLPYVDLGSDPPRVRPRTVLDLAAGYERRTEGRRRWDVQVQVSNVTGTVALYNFQSIFVGTRLIEPRSGGVKMRWYW
jgi:outer membrane cobalamin receptor